VLIAHAQEPAIEASPDASGDAVKKGKNGKNREAILRRLLARAVVAPGRSDMESEK
jgi:hypothetical protein